MAFTFSVYVLTLNYLPKALLISPAHLVDPCEHITQPQSFSPVSPQLNQSASLILNL